MPWNIILERASILRFPPRFSSGQRGQYVEEDSHFFISSVSAFPIFTTHRSPPILHLKASVHPPTSNPNPNPISNSTPFPVSYLIHNFGFSPQLASKLSYRLRFKTNQSPDLVLNFFRTHGFSDSQLRHMIAKAPWLLACDPSKRLLPKFLFFFSKGASTSDIVNLVTKCPDLLAPSLDNHIVPTYELLMQFHKDFLAHAIRNPAIFTSPFVARNVRMLIENEVPDTTISRLLRCYSKALCTNDLLKHVQQVKDLGFNPSQSTFSLALYAKTQIWEARWKAKADAFKKWGWSDEDVIQAFRKYPCCMVTSIDKINLVMSFWVNHLGWDAKDIAKGPRVLSANMERKIIPRTSVLQYLLKKGLLKNKTSLIAPFHDSDEKFIDRYIKPCKEDSSYLLKLFEEKLNLAHNNNNKNDMI